MEKELKELLTAANKNGITVKFIDTYEELIDTDEHRENTVFITPAMTKEETLKHIKVELFKLNILYFNSEYERIKNHYRTFLL